MGWRLGTELSLQQTKKSKSDQNKWPVAITAIASIAVLCLIFWYVYGGRATNSDYDGKIIDRWADYSNSEHHPQPSFHLLVESNDGRQLRIKVEPTVYESARVGMRIRSRSGQIVLIETDQKPAGK